MQKKVLIVDDDNDFNNLLNKVFSRSKYTITSCNDPDKALALIAQEEFDLIVTDHRMPNITGLDFSRMVKEKNSSIPIIMVSGFLDSETIRELINIGIEGVFLKPLNIFSLMEQTAKLLNMESEFPDEKTISLPEKTHAKPSLNSFPCVSEKSIKFSENLKAASSFRTNLILIGNQGSPFQEIIRDLSNFTPNEKSSFIFLKKEQIAHESLVNIIKQLPTPENNRITLVLPSIFELDKNAINQLGTTLSDYHNWMPTGLSLRTIFCLLQSPDTLLEKGVINEDFYLLMGTRELKIPNLCECPDDIPILAQQALENYCQQNDIQTPPQLTPDAFECLKKYTWPANIEELYAVINMTLKNTTSERISEHDLIFSSTDGLSATEASLKDKLKEYRDDYIRAVNLYFDSKETTQRLLEASPALLEQVIQN